jgi:hypothetical protein
VIPTEALLLLTEMDLAWPGGDVPMENKPAVLVWAEWLKPYSLDTARQAVRKFGGVQARPPSLAQVLGECRAITGELMPEADEVLAEFKQVVRSHSSRGEVNPAWFSTPEVGAFAASGAFQEFGDGPDPAYDSDNYAAAAAHAASMRRRWDAFAARVERVGLRAACERMRMNERVVEAVCGPAPRQIEAAS